MMDYELFKKVIADRIKDFLPPIFSGYRVNINVVHKVNQVKDTLIMMPGRDGEITAMPNIYLDEMYEEFTQCQDMEMILAKIAALIVHFTGKLTPEEVNVDFNEKKDSIVMNLINTERNEPLLANVPHKEIMDLSVVYRIIMGHQDHGFATVMVNNAILEELGMSCEELDQLAYVNTGRLFPVEIFKMSDMLYVMTNESKLHGATTMMYREAMEVLAEKIGGNFYLIPSSIHEVMAVPEDRGNLKRLIRMLEEGNRVCSTEKEILSNSIYHYSLEKGCFTLAASYYGKEELEEDLEQFL